MNIKYKTNFELFVYAIKCIHKNFKEYYKDISAYLYTFILFILSIYTLPHIFKFNTTFKTIFAYCFSFCFVIFLLLLQKRINKIVKGEFFLIYIFLVIFYISQIIKLNIGTYISSTFFILLIMTLFVSFLVFVKNCFLEKIIKVLGVFFGGIVLCMLHIFAKYIEKMNNSAPPGVERESVFLISIDEFSAIFQTNFYESIDFFVVFFTFYEKCIFFSSFVIGCFLMYISSNLLNKKNKKIPFKEVYNHSLILVILCIIFFIIYDPIKEPLLCLKHVRNQYENTVIEFKKYREIRAQLKSIIAKKKNIGELYVVVIGESANRRHLNAYGYVRDTTPFITSLRKDNNTIFLENAYSSFCHTIPSLMQALTQDNQYNTVSFMKAPSIIEVAQAAGFHVVWLSNQDCTTVLDTPLTTLAQCADTFESTKKGRFSSDEALLPMIDRTFKNLDYSQNNIVFVHLRGSHWDYNYSLPKNYNIDFASSEEYIGNISRDKTFVTKILNPYDRTIRYTDEILAKINSYFNLAKSEVKALCYFSDHGEDVFAKKFHNASLFTYPMARIPFFVKFSDGYKKTYKESFDNFARAKDYIFTLDCFFDTFLSLIDVENCFSNDVYNLLSSSYSITIDNALTQKTKESHDSRFYAKTNACMIKDDPLLIERHNLSLLNKHHPNITFAANYCDAIGAAKQAIYDGYKGLEVNVDANTMRIGHAPELLYTITLDEYLCNIDLEKLNVIWIDLKNVKDENIDFVLSSLEELNRKFKIKNKCIIESTCSSSKFYKFENYGWNTCYYLFIKRWQNDPTPGFDFSMLSKIKNLNLNDDILLSNFGRQIAQITSQRGARSLSFCGDTYLFIDKYVAPYLQNEISFNIFGIPNTTIMSDDSMSLFYKNPILDNKRINTVLVNPYTDFFISIP